MKVIDLVNVYEDLESPGKMHMAGSWKVLVTSLSVLYGVLMTSSCVFDWLVGWCVFVKDFA